MRRNKMLAASLPLPTIDGDFNMPRELSRVKTRWRFGAGLIGLFSILGLVATVDTWLQTSPFVFTFAGALLFLSGMTLGAIFIFVAISGRDPVNNVLARNLGLDDPRDRS